ncbi:putative hydroxyacid dehydrogenase/reductase; 3-hydroxyisobutyrate dehydrogenase [Bradyrhizobium sp. ORS 375]|uniref:NAD(P)-dependent oxidoreductase n=1 Tax=Bradyrhizobium sp. (strain ORS 375) TaxID=566679 RepID=UPI0002408632|nr:NAD(P)-binding domain-containing protein [Bradyrhizobium sp. ORS 375]CCD96136.1 putative hydroxyacid dehydrogenase/reductase; 3-hydroxyisobutyrate dehydrogenase [Bradyrhizobium sp. ORS 375]
MNAPKTVLFVGVGNMGWPMAARLLGAGFAVAVNDAVPGRSAEFVQKVGGIAAEDLAAAAAQADVVITMLPTSKHVADVVAALRAGLKQGHIVIDMSSGAPAATQAIATELAPLGVIMLDAPVSGGVPRAVTGELAIMAGGEAAALDRVEPLLRAMGTTIHRIGGLGSGQAMKALNNLVSAGGFLIGIEALLIGQQFGIDPGLMTDVLNASTGMNNSTQKKFKQFVLSRQFNSGFGLDLMVKDLSIALEVARANGVAAPFSNLCRELSASAQGLLGPGQDHTALAKLSEALAGVELGS